MPYWSMIRITTKKSTMSRMFNPPHPGEKLKEDILSALGLTVAAQQLGVTRTALSRVLNGHAAISPEMVRRIEAWLGHERGGRAEIWPGCKWISICGSPNRSQHQR